MTDTIYAMSSGAPPAAIAILRISGAGAQDALRSLCGAAVPARRPVLRAVRDPASDELLDRALVLSFPGPNSATGEDLVELHLHGGRAVVRGVEAALARLPGLRAAEAGEFTRRALTSGRIDLSEAEGLGDLLAAETADQRRLALRALEGEVGREVDGWSTRALTIAADIEALLDHADEDDVAAGAGSPAAIAQAATELAEAIETVIERPPVERVRDGLRVVLAGPPNAGKSTLLNAMTGRDVAIVSPIAGTTRDRIEAPVVREGVAYLLTDTAGLNATPDDAIERIGIARAEEALNAADILLWLGDTVPSFPVPTVWVHARADQPARAAAPDGSVPVSALRGDGIERLWARIGEVAADLLPAPDLISLNARQRQHCGDAAAALRSASIESDLLLAAEHVRSALRSFDAITGRAGVEAMLDALFSRFCIGK